MRLHRCVLVAVAVVVAALAAAAPPASAGAKYHGRVVDADTKAPLSGAVVVVIWFRKPITAMDSGSTVHRVVEVFTDADGRFSIDDSPGINWMPFTFVVKEPSIAIFRPGYAPFPTGQRSPRIEERFGRLHRLSTSELNAALRGGATVELPQLLSKEELRKFVEPFDMLIISRVPDEKIPNLIRLLEIQRANAGLESYRRPRGGSQ